MKRLLYLLTGTLVSFWLAGVGVAGMISGSVTVKGLPSPENVVVYIERAGKNKFIPPKESVILDQRNLTFIPHVMPVLSGTRVDFPNNDTVRHNVFSPSSVKRFDLGTYPPGATKSEVFDSVGAVNLLCSVHAEMSAYVLVLKNPYFAVTDKKGTFRIPNSEAMRAAKLQYPDLPEGVYLLKTWHEKLESASEEVFVPAKGEIQVHLSLTRGKPADPL